MADHLQHYAILSSTINQTMRLLILCLLCSAGDAAKSLSRDILNDYKRSDFVLSSPSSNIPSVVLAVGAAAVLQHVVRKYIIKAVLECFAARQTGTNDTVGVDGEESQSTDSQLREASSDLRDEPHWKEQFETLQQESATKTTLLESQIQQLQAQVEGDSHEMNYYKALIDQQQTELLTQRDVLHSQMMEMVQTEREKLLQEFRAQTELLRDRLSNGE